MFYNGQLEFQNIRSALDKLEKFLKENPEYPDNSDVQDGLEMLQTEVEEFVESHICENKD